MGTFLTLGQGCCLLSADVGTFLILGEGYCQQIWALPNSGAGVLPTVSRYGHFPNSGGGILSTDMGTFLSLGDGAAYCQQMWALSTGVPTFHYDSCTCVLVKDTDKQVAFMLHHMFILYLWLTITWSHSWASITWYWCSCQLSKLRWQWLTIWDWSLCPTSIMPNVLPFEMEHQGFPFLVLLPFIKNCLLPLELSLWGVDQTQTQKLFIQPHIIQSKFSHTLCFNIMGQRDLQ